MVAGFPEMIETHETLVATANHLNCLALPLGLELIRLAAEPAKSNIGDSLCVDDRGVRVWCWIHSAEDFHNHGKIGDALRAHPVGGKDRSPPHNNSFFTN
jgi:hypothetical protein